MPQGISGITIGGFDHIIDNLNKEIIKITKGARGGLVKASKLIQRDVETNNPLTPVKKGIMRASYTTNLVNEGRGSGKFGVTFGYNANYAGYVHFMRGAKNWTRAGSGPLWFQKAIERNHDQILQEVAAGIKNR